MNEVTVIPTLIMLYLLGIITTYLVMESSFKDLYDNYRIQINKNANPGEVKAGIIMMCFGWPLVLILMAYVFSMDNRK